MNRLRPALLGACEALASDVENTTKHLIGQELPEWPPLAQSTIDLKAKEGFGGQVSSTDPLLRTGQMRDSVKSGAELTPEGALFWVGSDSQVAVDQELGTARIPPRPFLALGMMKSEWKAEAELAEVFPRLYAGY